MVRYWWGDLAGAEEHFLAGQAFFEDPLYQQAPIGGPPNAFGWGALTAWALGRPHIARKRLAQTKAVAEQNNPGQLTESAFMAALVHLTMREYEEAEALAARAIELSQQHQLPNYTVAAQCFLGEACVQLGRTTEGIALLREGMAGMLRVGVRRASGMYSVWLSEAESRQGANLDGLKTIEQALEAYPDELKCWPEALRVRGELRAKQGGIDAAENDLRRAIALAQTMRAKMWELRATVSLARLLAIRCRRDEARTILAEIYNWFTEGFDTADLMEAKELLDELSG
jgi:tetratricopeptide (TPR) repeat protein